METVCIALFKGIGELQRLNFSCMLQRLAGMEICMDNFCKRRAEYFRCFLAIVYTECGPWKASFIQEKLACLAEVASVTKQIL